MAEERESIIEKDWYWKLRDWAQIELDQEEQHSKYCLISS